MSLDSVQDFILKILSASYKGQDIERNIVAERKLC